MTETAMHHAVAAVETAGRVHPAQGRKNSSVIKRSVIRNGHKSSISLEDQFWDALREIAEETVKPKELEEGIVTNLQKVRVDEEDETEELASLSDAAEALRLTAAAPPRPTPSGGDYE